MTVDPPPRKVEFVLFACLQPRVRPEVYAAEVKLRDGVIPKEVASLQLHGGSSSYDGL